ncbi:hypothetical protein [uncultured Chitinophaga sp.]|uniref:hypothetical protein n=1 Tax=uncultured Chitinophaga sp. TaxID=339340 RepID=UPI0025EBF43D|nr:hypothetical protein [uncultured Chitinophaga sp.]
MKRLAVYLLTGLLAITACDKNKEENELPVTPGTGKVTPVGTPEETAKAEKTIGAAGGTLSSLDGQMTVTIPAGAFTADQNVTIQRITNNNPMGIHSGYRITPHNVTFAKEVTITFPYTDEDVTNTVPEALGIAFQDANGVWQRIVDPVLDKTNKTVSVKTDHFSDWSFFETFEITTTASTLSVNESAILEVWSDADLLAPIQGNTQPIGERAKGTEDYIKGWKLTGAGKLKVAAGNKEATYTAPGTVPGSPNPVAITVNINLRKKGVYLLITHITIVDGEISVRVNGGEWFTQPASPSVKFADGYYSIAEADGDASGRFVFGRWPGGTGTFPFKEPTAPTGTHVHYHITGVDNYTASYINNERLVASGGGITITSIGEPNGFFEGTFLLEPAGHGPLLQNTAKVEGKFKIRRTW